MTLADSAATDPALTRLSADFTAHGQVPLWTQIDNRTPAQPALQVNLAEWAPTGIETPTHPNPGAHERDMANTAAQPARDLRESTARSVSAPVPSPDSLPRWL